MSCAEISIDNFKDFEPPRNLETSLSTTNRESTVAIAPWLAPGEQLDQSLPLPPKQRSFGFPSKASFSSFSLSSRHNSNANTANLSQRPSETLSISETSMCSSNDTVPNTTEPHELRKSKSSVFSNLLKRSRSRPQIRTTEVAPEPPLPDHPSLFSADGPPSPPIPLFLKKERHRGKKYTTRPPPLLARQADPAADFNLDLNVDDMRGIINPAHPLLGLTSGSLGASSPGSGLASFHSISDEVVEGSARLTPSPASHMFVNPFKAPPAGPKPHPLIDFDKKVPPNMRTEWEPPESWAVEGLIEDAEAPDYSSSDESIVGGQATGRPSSVSVCTPKRHKRRKTHRVKSPSYKSYKIRIYRADNSYHILAIALTIPVSDVIPILNQKLLQRAEHETHKLYLKEQGRERVLAATERPADITRRRLEQAGYTVEDGLDVLGAEDLTFLMKFVYKSQLLGPAEEELNFDTFEYIDLTGRSLRTVPVLLHAHADTIVSLNLSRNPMLEIPLDFIQSCTTLRELRLSNMAMKKVPQSVRHSATLHRLDLSCNRIVDLDEAGLDWISELTTLYVQNNRMEKLPWYFPRLRALKYLNISNNKFRLLPAVVAEMISLVDLDISFNMISELPEEISQLHSLERFIMVGNQVTKFPAEYKRLRSLRLLDCRRNCIADLSVMCMLPALQILKADNNTVHSLDLALGPNLATLDASHNDITQITLLPGLSNSRPFSITSLDISHAKLSTLDDFALGKLTALQTLKLNSNSFRSIPESLGELFHLVSLSCSDNQLDTLPSSIGRLQKLEFLDAHNNSLTELPISLWQCASLSHVNVTSNLLGMWHLPSSFSNGLAGRKPSADNERVLYTVPERKSSVAASVNGRPARALPPLCYSLERLYLGENRLTDDVLPPLSILKELRVLNLSFNEIQELPTNFFKNLTHLEEVYLSGNQLSSLPTEDLFRLTKLAVLFLNGNRFQNLPPELGKVKSLSILDVGSNVLKYNVNNWEFDWNWNFNQNLQYLNLSGNRRLDIKPETSGHKVPHRGDESRKVLADFSSLTQLRVLGLMEVTLTHASPPEESESRRVRTSPSEVNKMAYGIADGLGRNEHMNMVDLVQPEFRERKDEAIFAMFGRSQPFGSSNKLSKFLHDNFLQVFSTQLDLLDHSRAESAPDALRRAFLRLNKLLHDELYATSSSRKLSMASVSTSGSLNRDHTFAKCGASGIVLYFKGKTMYVANAGNALAVVSRQGTAELVSRKHDPFDRRETARIRSAEGWVSPKGLVNDEIDVSRAFGFYHLLPVVNAQPDVFTWHLSPLDEFVIIGNQGLWDYVSYQTAVDVARSERDDPMIAAQKLRDFAISYGAKGSTMIMIISVADPLTTRSRQPTMDPLGESEALASTGRGRRRKDEITDRIISRLDGEVSAPVGHVALVFTDIRNSTHLWEVNSGMAASMRLHNNLLRRLLRLCGGYEVKTEGDAFMCSFRTALSAMWWCLAVQTQLLHEPWPLEVLECEDGKEIYDKRGKLVTRGLSVRMGIHCGQPYCEPDPITHRMDYFGPMVNRTSRISGCAAGGQIMCSANTVRELNAKVFETEPETEYSEFQPQNAIDAIRRIGLTVISVGEVKLKGLEVPEFMSLVYPANLEGRQELANADAAPSVSASRVPFSVEQMRELATLCLRLEALASGRIFRPISARKGNTPGPSNGSTDEIDSGGVEYMYGDPDLLVPIIWHKATDKDLMHLLDSLTVRIQNAQALISLNEAGKRQAEETKKSNTEQVVAALRQRSDINERTMNQILSLLPNS